MKKALSTVLCTLAVLTSASMTYAFTSSHVTISDAQEQVYMSTIDTFFTTYLTGKQKTPDLVMKLNTIRNTVVTYLNTTDVEDYIFFALEYLVHIIDLNVEAIIADLETIPTPPAPVVVQETTTTTIMQPTQSAQQQVVASAPQTQPALNNQPTTAPQTQPALNASTTQAQPIITPTQATASWVRIVPGLYLEGDKNILAWAQSWPIGEFELVAQFEWVLIDTITLRASNPEFSRLIREVQLFNEEGYMIASHRPTSNVTQFRDIHLLVPTGQTELYVWVVTHPIWYQELGSQWSFSFSLDITEAEGATSGQSFTRWITATSNDLITIVPTYIDRAYITDSRRNASFDKRLYGTRNNTLWILVISTLPHNTTDTRNWQDIDTQLDEVTVFVDDGTTWGDVASTLFIQEIGGRGNEAIWTINSDGSVTFDMSDLWSDALIRSWEEVAYEIIWTATLWDDWWSLSNEYVRVDLKSINSGGIVYSTTDPTSTPISNLNLRIDHDGVTLSE